MDFQQLKEFEKDKKKLLKKYRSISEDRIQFEPINCGNLSN